MIVAAGRSFVALRKNGPGLAGREIPTYHAVAPHCRIALCATEPGARSGWAEPPSAAVTCKACLAKLARLRGSTRRRHT
jgi:hypothetical protein